MKYLAVAVAVLVLALVTGNATALDIVILSTGERMDVESYEVQRNIVVVKTWDGRLRALPRAYVDLEATKAVNDHPTPEQEIAPERLQKARQACDDYGVQNSVTIYRQVLDAELQKLRGRMTLQTYDVLRASFRNAFDDERTYDAVVALFAENANLDLLGSWSAWLKSPLARRMVALENTELDHEAALAASRYYINLRSDAKAYEARLELINRLDEARKSTQSGVQVVLHLVEAFYEAGNAIFPDEQIEFDAENLRQRLAPAVKEANLEGLLVLFRDASDDEIEKYTAYWNSRDGQRVVALMNAAIEAGARQGSDIAMQMVAGKRHIVP